MSRPVIKSGGWRIAVWVAGLAIPFWAGLTGLGPAQNGSPKQSIPLPSSKLLLSPAPGSPQLTNSFPTAIALSPGGRFAALLNNGRGTEESDYQQSIAIFDFSTNQVSDFPDPRLKVDALQTYFLGLAFSADGNSLYASMASLTDPDGGMAGSTGNGIAVYSFQDGKVAPARFVRISMRPPAPRKRLASIFQGVPGRAVPYPAGLAGIPGTPGDKILVAANLSDEALLLDTRGGQVLQRIDLSSSDHIPAAFPYGVVVTRDGQHGYCSLWNASEVAELDLREGKATRRIFLRAPDSPTVAGSHPTAMLLSPDEKHLYVTLSNADEVAVIDTASAKQVGTLSTLLPGQHYGGTFPNALAQSTDGKRLFVAAASLDAVAVFDLTKDPSDTPEAAMGFIPTEWYPTALAVRGDDLLIASGKGQGTGPNDGPEPADSPEANRSHPYIPSLIRGSVARISISEAERALAQSTDEVEESNLMQGRGDTIPFKTGGNPIKHVIYIIKENRTYDQIFGDLTPGDGDASLCMYGEKITPNLHQLVRQFGILDNFYDSGEVSGDGHVWSTAAITSDYTEKTWQIAYRGRQRSYDYEGSVAEGIPLRQGLPDVNEPSSGYIWTNVAKYNLTHRNYGEFVETRWCDETTPPGTSPREGTPLPPGVNCQQKFIHKGEPLPANVGQPHGAPSPWPWPVPIIGVDVATKPELEGHFDPRFANFRLDYPDQLRADEFLNEFADFVKGRGQGPQAEFPQFIILRLPNDHTAATEPRKPRPDACVADNDLAVGRIVEAVSHSPYWDDTAIFILEDDAQDGADHVDAHRSTALVISKYSPGSAQKPFVDHNFYTTVNMLRTIEVLLGLPPMNNNDAQAAAMAPMFSGSGDQPAFNTDWTNLRNGLVYKMNSPASPGAKESAKMDFSHADAADAQKLNAILWRASKGDVPMPAPRHRVIRKED